jgi:hypothetical protein
VVQSVNLDGSGRRSGDTLSATAADQLVYASLRDVQTLALGGSLRQDPASAISVEFTSPDDTASISVSRGKNKNVSIQCTSKTLGEALQAMDKPFSVIAPGLAGIPSYEEFRSEGIVRRAATRGDANSVFRNVLWILRNDPAGWAAFQDRLSDVFPDTSIDVSFDLATDEHIRVYSPQLLILDEPDAHLHPDNQRELIRLLKAAPRGRSRPPPRRPPRRSRCRSRSRSVGAWCRSAGATRQAGAAGNRGSHRAAVNLTRGPLAAAPIGLTGASWEARPIAGKRTSRRPRVKSAALSV